MARKILQKKGKSKVVAASDSLAIPALFFYKETFFRLRIFAIFDGFIFPSNNQKFFFKLIQKLLILSEPKFRCGHARPVLN